MHIHVNGKLEMRYLEIHPRLSVPYLSKFKSYVKYILFLVQRKVGLQCSLNMSFDTEIMFCSLLAFIKNVFVFEVA